MTTAAQQKHLASCLGLNIKTEPPVRSYVSQHLLEKVEGSRRMTSEVCKDYAFRRGIKVTAAEIEEWKQSPNFADLLKEQLLFYTDEDLKDLRRE